MILSYHTMTGEAFRVAEIVIGRARDRPVIFLKK